MNNQPSSHQNRRILIRGALSLAAHLALYVALSLLLAGLPLLVEAGLHVLGDSALESGIRRVLAS